MRARAGVSSVMALALMASALLMGCGVKDPPNGVLVCTATNECPADFLCVPQPGGRSVCCRRGDCGAGGGRGGTASGGNAGGGRDGNGGNGMATGGVAGAGSSLGGRGGDQAQTGIVILHDGFEEMDLDTTCLGTTCITGGLTP